MLKLCVGIESLEDLLTWRQEFARRRTVNGVIPDHYHITRMVPKRADELLDGGSLYWVVKGQIQARQRFTGIEAFVDGDGIRRCKLSMDQEVVPTQWQPKRAFQGWRYLKPDEAPDDLGAGQAAVPPKLRAELADLGLL